MSDVLDINIVGPWINFQVSSLNCSLTKKKKKKIQIFSYLLI